MKQVELSPKIILQKVKKMAKHLEDLEPAEINQVLKTLISATDQDYAIKQSFK